MNIDYRKLTKNSPCKDCADRHVGCHSTCENYKDYQKKILAVKTTIYKERSKEKMLNSYVVTQQMKNAKRQNLKKPYER